MWRSVAFVGVLLLSSPAVVVAQPSCTTDAHRIVDEIYRHVLERAPDSGSGDHVERLVRGSTTVRDVVRLVAKSPEHTQRFFPPAGSRDERERAIGTLHRHLLGRQPDAASARKFAEAAAARGVGAVVDDILGSPEYRKSFGDNGVPGSPGLRYCGSGRSRGTQARSRADEMRFRGMDRNHDGVIARIEWHGSGESFHVHDWNRDGLLSGDEVRPGGHRDAGLDEEDFDPAVDQFPSWSDAGFSILDRNGDGRLTSNEWHNDPEIFHRVDRNADGTLSRTEFLETGVDDDRDDRFEYLDVNANGRLERHEWHGTLDAFHSLDRNNDDVLTQDEVDGRARVRPDRFATLDANRNGAISADEWPWSRRSFDQQDVNRDGVLTRREFSGGRVSTPGPSDPTGRVS